MILTGNEIAEAIDGGGIVITPYSREYIEPNSYRVTLGRRLLECASDSMDSRIDPPMTASVINDEGRVLEPGRLYLGETGEVLGSPRFAATLYATRSMATIGMWIHVSAPLGHTGAVIRWTLEIRVAQPLVVYPGMTIGKIAFWRPDGTVVPYIGRYRLSRTVRPSALREDAQFKVATIG